MAEAGNEAPNMEYIDLSVRRRKIQGYIELLKSPNLDTRWKAAENLGVITPEVEALRRRFRLPGMAILQFAFGKDPQAPSFRPHAYERDTVAYTGTVGDPEPGRAHVAVYNWDLKPTVDVDLSNAGLKIGDTYEVRDAENFYNGPVATGTYSGAPVTIPMQNLTVVQPYGNVPYPPSHTAPPPQSSYPERQRQPPALHVPPAHE